MTHREFSFVNADGIENTYIEITNDDGSLTTFLKSEENSAYVQWLHNQKELGGTL